MKPKWYQFALSKLLPLTILISGWAVFVSVWACGGLRSSKVDVPKWTVNEWTIAIDRDVKVSRITPQCADAGYALSLTADTASYRIVQTGITVNAEVPPPGAGYLVAFCIRVFPDRIEPDSWPMPSEDVSWKKIEPQLAYYYDGDDLIVVSCWGNNTRLPYYYSVRYHLENRTPGATAGKST
jgi:hypothetical protein